MKLKNVIIRCLSIFFVLTMIVILLPYSVLADNDGMTKVKISMYSNKTDYTDITGYCKDNVFYVSSENICLITGAKIVEQNRDWVKFSLNNGIRNLSVHYSKNLMTEDFFDETFSVTMYSFWDDSNNCPYISLTHFLSYIGADFQLNKDSSPQLMVMIKYNIFDAISESENKDYSTFWWDQVSLDKGNIEDEIFLSGIISLINKDSNIFRMMFDAEGIQKEAIEDTLVNIIKTDGAIYFDGTNNQLDLLNLTSDAYSTETDIVKFITEAYKSDATENLGLFIDDFSSKTSSATSSILHFINAYETMKQYDNITNTQRNLIEKTILSDYEKSNTLLSSDWSIIYDAAKVVDNRAKDAYNNNYAAGLEVVSEFVNDYGDNLIGKGGINPVKFAWDGAMLIAKVIPFTSETIETKNMVYNAYLASMIELSANEMYTSEYNDLYYSNFHNENIESQITSLQKLKYNLILQLKSVLSAKESLISSGVLNSFCEEEFKKENKLTAEFLNRVENCSLSGLGTAYENRVYEKKDYSWISEYEYDKKFPNEIFGNYMFSSGAGAWSTELNINDDFTFSGMYHDSELGLTGEKNPNGTVIICEFTGKFSKPEKIDNYTYKLSIESLSLKNKDGYVYYKDGIEYECIGEPYGFDGCREFYLYVKGREASDLSEEFLGWIYEYDENSGVLPCNCIRNPQTDVCFVKYESTETNSTEDTHDESTTVKESTSNNVGKFFGNQTAEQLRKSIVGSWDDLGAIIPEYNFQADGTFNQNGKYSISDDKTLTISRSGKANSDVYIWSSESWNDFYSHNEYGTYFWYMTDDGVLKLNGKEKYRDGVDNFTYNSDGDLMKTISGTWINDTRSKEYRIYDDGTWEESTVYISGGHLISRKVLDNGEVEIVDNTTAKLWQEVEHLNQIPGASELIYDSKSDKISVGGTNNTYIRAKYK